MHVIVEKHEHTGILHLNRPQAKNALNHALIVELGDAFARLDEDPDTYVIVIAGKNGDFVAGADIKEMAGISMSAAYEVASRVKALHDHISNSSKPVIACIEGYCLGGGMELMLACDIRIASHTATFGLPECRLGIIPGGGGTQRLLDIVGPAVASHLIFTGNFISAQRAYELNLVSELADDPLASCLALAHRLAHGSRTALAAAKRMIAGQIQQRLQRGLETERHEFSRLFDCPDSREGMQAFMEKRKPAFR